MSLLKLAYSGFGTRSDVRDAIGNNKGMIRSRLGLYHYDQQQKHVAELARAQEHYKSLSGPAGAVGRSDALAAVQKARTNLHQSSQALKHNLNPGGAVVPFAAKPTETIAVPNVSVNTEKSATGILGKAKDFVKANPKAVGIGAAIAGGGYLLHKMTQNKQQQQPVYYN